MIGKLAQRLGVEADGLTLKDGHAISSNRQIPFKEILNGETLTEMGTIEPGKTDDDYTQASYGAHFCEVAVNAYTGETRVKRLLPWRLPAESSTRRPPPRSVMAARSGASVRR